MNELLNLYRRVEMLERRLARLSVARRNIVEWPSGGGGEFDWSKRAFGFTRSGAVVTILAGDFPRGKRVPAEATQTNVAISSDHQYIPIAYHLTNHTVAIEAATLAKPQSDSTYWRTWLFQFRLSGGVASLERWNPAFFIAGVYS